MLFKVYFLFMCCLYMMNLGFVIAKHGEPRDPYDGNLALFSTALILPMLYAAYQFIFN